MGDTRRLSSYKVDQIGSLISGGIPRGAKGCKSECRRMQRKADAAEEVSSRTMMRLVFRVVLTCTSQLKKLIRDLNNSLKKNKTNIKKSNNTIWNSK